MSNSITDYFALASVAIAGYATQSRIASNLFLYLASSLTLSLPLCFPSDSFQCVERLTLSLVYGPRHFSFTDVFTRYRYTT